MNIFLRILYNLFVIENNFWMFAFFMVCLNILISRNNNLIEKIKNLAIFYILTNIIIFIIFFIYNFN